MELARDTLKAKVDDVKLLETSVIADEAVALMQAEENDADVEASFGGDAGVADVDEVV